MKIIIAAVGKMKAGPEKTLADSYLKRIPWNITIKEIEEKKNLSGEKLKSTEGKLLLAASEKTKRIVLDERGDVLSSIAFARKINSFGGPVSFLIGGAEGHGDEVRSNADFLLSLGKMTWPHMLARAMLAEQIYRAHTILSGHPYHKV